MTVQTGCNVRPQVSSLKPKMQQKPMLILYTHLIGLSTDNISSLEMFLVKKVHITHITGIIYTCTYLFIDCTL